MEMPLRMVPEKDSSVLSLPRELEREITICEDIIYKIKSFNRLVLIHMSTLKRSLSFKCAHILLQNKTMKRNATINNV